MKKNITVWIESENTPPGGNTDKTSEKVSGILYIKNDLYLISYKENSEGFDDTTTTLKFKRGRLELMRSGKVCSHIIFESGRPFNGIYPTPYGDFSITVTVNEIEISAGDDSGEIHIDYLLDLAGEKIRNKFNLKYKSAI